MLARVTQPCRVQEEGLLGCKLLLEGNKMGMRANLSVPSE